MSLDSATTPIKDTINDASTQNSLFEMTNKSKKLAEHDALYMAEQRRQDIFYAQYENQCTEEIPLIDENILFNLERRKKKDICRHCKGKCMGLRSDHNERGCLELPANASKCGRQLASVW